MLENARKETATCKRVKNTRGAVREESRLRTRESKKALRAGTNDTSIELF